MAKKKNNNNSVDVAYSDVEAASASSDINLHDEVSLTRLQKVDSTDKELQTRGRKYLWAAAVFAFAALIAFGMIVASQENEQRRPFSEKNKISRLLSSDSALTEQVISRTYDVVFMARKLYLDDPTVEVPGATVYTDEPDRALWIKKDDTCFAIFRAVTPQAIDWMQSIPLGPPVEFKSALGKTCTAIDGYHRAYYGTNFVNQFRTEVTNCVNSCMNGKCDFVIGGSSQGAGIATIAAVDMDDLNPMLITSGQPPTLLQWGDGPCEAIDTTRYFRFVNTEEDDAVMSDDSRLRYDMVPCLALPNGTDWLGNLFILSDNEGGLVHYPNYVRPNIPPYLWHANAHLIVNYLPRLEALTNANAFPIPTDGWVDGSLCNFDTECQSGLCHKYKCLSPGADGAPCNDASECLSGRCDGMFNPVCKPKLCGGSWCSEDSDCLSGNCSLGKCTSSSSAAQEMHRYWSSWWLLVILSLLLVPL